MRAQMEALKHEQAQLQETLRRAEDMRMAKEGEVSILRKGMQKTAQEHAAEMAKIKTAKEAAEAMQLKIQNEKKEEIDRLKTQYTFKQHELETSGRGSPWSTRPRKISRQVPSTPGRVPSQMREWNPLGIDDSAGLISFNDVATSTQQANGARRAHEPRQQRIEVVADKVIPGFVNAFDSTPPRPSQDARSKVRPPEGVRDGMTTETSDNFFTQPPSHIPPSSPLGLKQARRNQGQIQLGVRDNATQVRVQEPTPRPVDVDGIEDLSVTDWAAEVHRIILTHKSPSSTQLTMQVLMGATLPDTASQEHRDAFHRLSKSLLENLGVMLSDLVDEDHAIRTVLDILVRMADVLQACSVVAPLISLLGLLRVLVLWLPKFSRLMFARPEGAEDAGDVIFGVVSKIICNHLAPIEGERSADFEALAKETLELLEDIAWVIPEEYTTRLATVPTQQDVMNNLLAPAHPTWFLHHSVRVLVLIASHHSIFRSLLSIPDAQTNMDVDDAAPAPAKDFSKIPHIEQMASYLRDTTRTGAEADLLRDAIMTFVATICMAHTDAVTILQQSHMLIPSMIVFLSTITTPLFEEDPELLDAPDQLEATVTRSVRSVSVLYTLVFAADNSFTLYHNSEVSPRDVPSMYDVPWADPPLEATEDMKNLLDQALDLSRALLETFVEPPLLEMVWSAFQVGDEEPQKASGGRVHEVDDEEEEARNQHRP
ncbi:uncharacterized protein B0H18DRAFT_1040417, partial [Fomitopsis serialis]|uniref:uncharacterized protein n=1 Tax=Fomitopsis serialis TaxID=139415 RepID=UPI0020074C4B